MTRRFAWSLQATLGALGLVGVVHALAREWPAVFALYAVGRDTPAAALPWALGAALLVSLAAFLHGRFARLGAVSFVLTAAALHAAVASTYHNNYYLLVWAVGLAAAFGDPAYRLARLVRGDVPAEDGVTGRTLVRLVRALVAVVYLFSVVVKLSHPWWRGSGQVIVWLATVRAPSLDPGLVQAALGPVLRAPALARAAEWAVMLTEVALPFALASRRTHIRAGAFAVGVAMHTVMHAWLFPQLFTFLMLALYGAWVPVGDRARSLVLDPARPLHARLARWVPALDWSSRLHIVSAPGPLRLRGPDAATEHRGPAAWMGVLCRLPGGLLLWATLSLALPDTLYGAPRALVDNALTLLVLTSALWGRGRRA